MFTIVLIIFIILLAIDLFLRLKPKKHHGEIVVTHLADGKKRFVLELDSDPDEIEDQKSIIFKVKTEWSPLDDDLE